MARASASALALVSFQPRHCRFEQVRVAGARSERGGRRASGSGSHARSRCRLWRRTRVERERLVQIGEPQIAQPAVAPAACRLLELGGNLPPQRLEQARRGEHVLAVEVLEDLLQCAVLARVGKELDHVPPFRRAEGAPRIGDRRVGFLLQIVHAKRLAQDQRPHLAVQLGKLVEIAPPRALGLSAALAREVQPPQHGARIGALVAARPGGQVDEVAELRGRGEGDDLGRIVGSHFEQRQIELVLGDRLHQRFRIGCGEEQIDLFLAARGLQRAARRPQIDKRRAVSRFGHGGTLTLS